MSEFVTRLLDDPVSAAGGAATFRSAAGLLVWLAYLAVPVVLLACARGRTPPLRRVFGLLAVFVALGGVVHALWLLSAGAGPAAGAWLAAAAAVLAWARALGLLRLLPRAADAVEHEARGGELS